MDHKPSQTASVPTGVADTVLPSRCLPSGWCRVFYPQTAKRGRALGQGGKGPCFVLCSDNTG